MRNEKNRIGVGDVLLPVVSALYLVGSLTFFAPCGPKEDGGWMTCHWAGQTVAGLAAVLTVIALIHLFASDSQVKCGLDLAMIPVALLAAVVPRNLIGLCMMHTMRCWSLMRPAAILLSALVVVVAALDALMRRKKG